MTPTTSSSLASTTNFNITPQNPQKTCYCHMKQTRDTKRQHHTPEPPKKLAYSATWSKRVTPTTSSSLASTTNFNITPQNPEPHETTRRPGVPPATIYYYILLHYYLLPGEGGGGDRWMHMQTRLPTTGRPCPCNKTCASWSTSGTAAFRKGWEASEIWRYLSTQGTLRWQS